MNTEILVSRGAKLLDSHKPGWYNDVNADALDMSSPDNCILGQTLGYLAGADKLKLYSHTAMVCYGFQPLEAIVPFNPGLQTGYIRLERAWIKLILNRRKLRSERSIPALAL